MSNAMEVGKKLVELCRQGKNMEAINTLYGPNIVSIEAHSMPSMHSGKAEGPWPHGDRFIVRFTYDVTPKTGPMAGKRFTMDEAALYTVKDGKVVHEEFFYSMG
jgi:hypothetical protein